MIITLGNKTSEELGLKLFSCAVSPPEPKLTYISVPGRDGSIDVSELDGMVHFQDRTITLAFTYEGSWENWLSFVSTFNGLFLGQKVKIILSDDSNYYYFGRLKIAMEKSNPVNGDITLTAQCDPYKYKHKPTEKEFNVSGTYSAVLSNGRMPACPTVTTDSEMEVTFNESTFVFAEGTHTAPQLLLIQGNNQLTIKGNGHIKFEYQEGDL